MTGTFRVRVLYNRIQLKFGIVSRYNVGSRSPHQLGLSDKLLPKNLPLLLFSKKCAWRNSSAKVYFGCYMSFIFLHSFSYRYFVEVAVMSEWCSIVILFGISDHYFIDSLMIFDTG